MLKLSFDLLHYCNYNYIFSKTKCAHYYNLHSTRYKLAQLLMCACMFAGVEFMRKL